MSVDDVWRAKSDEQLRDAAGQLDDYTEEGRAAIRAEIERRGLDTHEYAPIPAPDHAVGTDINLERRGPLLSRVWRGECSLPVTYWIWGVIGTRLAAPVPALALETDSLLLVLCAFGLYVSYFVFVAVAVWRSGDRYPGRRIWRDLARVSIAIGVVRMIGELVHVE